MWSKPPSTKTPAHKQNEEYCTVAIQNPLTTSAWTLCSQVSSHFLVLWCGPLVSPDGILVEPFLRTNDQRKDHVDLSGARMIPHHE